MTATNAWHRRPLWLDIDAPPPLKFSKAAREFRARLRDFSDPLIDPVIWDRRHSEQVQQLQPLVRRISYTHALIDGAFRCYLEYRPCDKSPHYRVEWGPLFWGRADVRGDTDTHGADILGYPILPDVQKRLASYLIALGYRIGSARLRPHEISIEDEDEGDVLFAANVKTDTREHRLFSLDTNEVRSRRKKAAKLEGIVHEQHTERAGQISA